MNKFDGRKLDHKTLEELRIRAVLRVEAGESPEVVIKALGFTRARIYEWLALYREGGLDALKAKTISGRPPKLTGSQLKKIYRTVVDKDPRQLKFPFALWTCAMVRVFIKREFGIRVSEVTVGRLLKKLGLSPQRPVRQAIQQKKELVVDWMAKDFPAIKKMAQQEKATIYFGDEASVRSDYHSGTTWAPKGKTPVVKTTGSRFRVNIISAIASKGDLRFMATEKRVTAEVFCEFLNRLIANAPGPVFLILDQHPVHRSTKVKEFVAATQGRLKLFYLPPYSPDLNPDELVWSYVKKHNVGKCSVENKAGFKKMVKSTLHSLQKMPAKIRSFFRHPVIQYTELFAY